MVFGAPATRASDLLFHYADESIKKINSRVLAGEAGVREVKALFAELSARKEAFEADLRTRTSELEQLRAESSARANAAEAALTERGTDYQRQLATLVNRIQSMLDVNDRDVDTLVGNDEWRQAVEQYLRNGTLAELQAEAERILRPPYVDAPSTPVSSDDDEPLPAPLPIQVPIRRTASGTNLPTPSLQRTASIGSPTRQVVR